jgi:hypothetical protein
MRAAADKHWQHNMADPASLHHRDNGAYADACKGVWGVGIRVDNVIPVEEQVREVLTEEYRREMVGAQSLKRDSMPEVANVIFVFGK